MLLILLSSAGSKASSPNNPLSSFPLLAAEMSRGVVRRCPAGALGPLCEDLRARCRGGVLLCARATVQQNNEIAAIAVRRAMFELIARLSSMTGGINRILPLFRRNTHLKAQ